MENIEQAYKDIVAEAFKIPVPLLTSSVAQEKSPADIIPEDYQNELIMLRERKRDIYFRIGDIANELILMYKGSVTAKKIYASMSPFCDCSPRTIRYYAENSSFFPQDVRDSYDVVSFSQFDLARTFKENWLMVLNIAANHPNWSVYTIKGNVNRALEQLQGKFLSPENPMCDSVLNLSNSEFDYDYNKFFGADYIIPTGCGQDTTIPDGVATVSLQERPKANSARLVGEISDLSYSVVQLIDSYGERLPDELKDALIGHVVGLTNAIPAITVALDGDGAK